MGDAKDPEASDNCAVKVLLDAYGPEIVYGTETAAPAQSGEEIVPVEIVTGRKAIIVVVHCKDEPRPAVPLPVGPAVVFVPMAPARPWSAVALSWISNTSFSVPGDVVLHGPMATLSAMPAIIIMTALLVNDVNPADVIVFEVPEFVTAATSNGFDVSTPEKAVIEPAPSSAAAVKAKE